MMEWYLIKEPNGDAERAYCTFRSYNEADVRAAYNAILANCRDYNYTIMNSDECEIKIIKKGIV